MCRDASVGSHLSAVGVVFDAALERCRRAPWLVKESHIAFLRQHGEARLRSRCRGRTRRIGELLGLRGQASPSSTSLTMPRRISSWRFSSICSRRSSSYFESVDGMPDGGVSAGASAARSRSRLVRSAGLGTCRPRLGASSAGSSAASLAETRPAFAPGFRPSCGRVGTSWACAGVSRTRMHGKHPPVASPRSWGRHVPKKCLLGPKSV